MNIEIMKETTKGSLAGTMTFPEVVMNLTAEGVESYQADLVRCEKRFYMPGGESYAESIDIDAEPISENFSNCEIIAALRAIQGREISYREFLRRIMSAGITTYTVYLNGKKAIYFGRNGDFYVEDFPRPK